MKPTNSHAFDTNKIRVRILGLGLEEDMHPTSMERKGHNVKLLYSRMVGVRMIKSTRA